MGRLDARPGAHVDADLFPLNPQREGREVRIATVMYATGAASPAQNSAQASARREIMIHARLSKS